MQNKDNNQNVSDSATGQEVEVDSRLLYAIMKIMMEKGMRATTMDMVASRLSISKRTLYEIFGSKEMMLIKVLQYFKKLHADRLTNLMMGNEGNMMRAIIDVMEYHIKIFETINVNFFADMDDKFRKLRSQYDVLAKGDPKLMRVFELGVEQGVFLADINYELMQRLLNIQMESLKRMEEIFPADVTLVEACRAIVVSFLRGIATDKGRKTLEDYIKNKSSEHVQTNEGIEKLYPYEQSK